MGLSGLLSLQRSVAGLAAALGLGYAGELLAEPPLPMAYPGSLLEAPATLEEPPADFVRLGKPVVRLDVTTLEEAAVLTNGTRFREGRGVFARDIMCLSGTEDGRPVLAWLIASDTVRVSEVQLFWGDEPDEGVPGGEAPRVCRRLAPEHLPIRLGKIGLGMTKKDVWEFVGAPSHVAEDGWHYWFSQRFLRNARNLQELELNWLAVRFDDEGRAERAFISLVKNP